MKIIYKIWSKFLTWFGDLYFATRPPQIKAHHIRKILELLEPGDIICRKYIYYLDSYFIKGQYSHSGLVIDNKTMIHSIAEGVGKIDPIDFIKDCDGFILLRPKYTYNGQAQKAINWAEMQIGKPYDFIFDKSNKDAFYCHELTVSSLNYAGILIIPKESIIYAEDLLNTCSKIYEV